MKLEAKDLEVLHFNLADLEGLTEQQQKVALRKRYLNLARTYHPDRGGSGEKFKTLTEAYNNILDDNEDKFLHGINDYFLSTAIDIPDTAFDLVIEEAIMDAYEELLKTFAGLSSEAEKQSFAQQHAAFLNLAQSLGKKQNELNAKRLDYMIAQMNDEPLWQKYKREWRRLIISLFAEEYLDDFQYRHALATGELSAIIAWRKLLSPIKLIVAALNSLILAARVLGHYLFNDLMMSPLMQEFSRLSDNHIEGNLSKSAAFFWVIKLVGVLALILVPFIFFPTTATILLGIPLLGDFLNVLACPVNKIIRPLAQYTNLSPYLIGTGLAALLGTSLFLIISFFPPVALGTTLLAASVALTIYSFYNLGKFIKKIYDINPKMAYLQLFIIGVSTAIGIGLSFIPGGTGAVALDELSNSLTLFINSLMGTAFAYQANESFDHMKEEFTTVFESLPLPAEEVTEEIKGTVLQQVKTGHYSTRFFNTSKTAQFIAPNERTFWQKTASFFGGGERVAKPAEKVAGEVVSPTPLLLTCSAASSS